MVMKSKNIGKKVIARGSRSGVFFGELVSMNGQNVELKNARKLFKWDGAGAVEQIAVDGVSNPKGCKFTVVVESIEVLDIIQIINCTEKAIKCIESVKEWKC
jgi:hypothetical protein